MRFCLVCIQLVVVLLVTGLHAEARTRAPKTENEKSLLYWRYLCENQAQVETFKQDHTQTSPITLQCASQNWKVYSDGDQVREVVEDAKK